MSVCRSQESRGWNRSEGQEGTEERVGVAGEMGKQIVGARGGGGADRGSECGVEEQVGGADDRWRSMWEGRVWGL